MGRFLADILFFKKLFWGFLFFFSLYFAQTKTQLVSNRPLVEKWTSWPFMGMSSVTFKNDESSITFFLDGTCVCVYTCINCMLFKSFKKLWLFKFIFGEHKMWSLSDSATGWSSLWPHMCLSTRQFPCVPVSHSPSPCLTGAWPCLASVVTPGQRQPAQRGCWSLQVPRGLTVEPNSLEAYLLVLPENLDRLYSSSSFLLSPEAFLKSIFFIFSCSDVSDSLRPHGL